MVHSVRHEAGLARDKTLEDLDTWSLCFWALFNGDQRAMHAPFCTYSWVQGVSFRWWGVKDGWVLSVSC